MFFSHQKSTSWVFIFVDVTGKVVKSNNSASSEFDVTPGEGVILSGETREVDCVSREGGGERNETWFFRIEDQRTGSSFLRMPLGRSPRGTNPSPRNFTERCGEGITRVYRRHPLFWARGGKRGGIVLWHPSSKSRVSRLTRTYANFL